jgi:hypothetical protein
MSIRMGIVRSVIRMRWGIMSVGGTRIGNSKKTGRTAVSSGIVSRRLDGWGFVRVTMSFVASNAIRNTAKRANSV